MGLRHRKSTEDSAEPPRDRKTVPRLLPRELGARSCDSSLWRIPVQRKASDGHEDRIPSFVFLGLTNAGAWGGQRPRAESPALTQRSARGQQAQSAPVRSGMASWPPGPAGHHPQGWLPAGPSVLPQTRLLPRGYVGPLPAITASWASRDPGPLKRWRHAQRPGPMGLALPREPKAGPGASGSRARGCIMPDLWPRLRLLPLCLTARGATANDRGTLGADKMRWNEQNER